MQAVTLGNYDITGMVSKIEWSGSVEEVARKCDLTYINAPYDPVVAKLPVPKLGDYVTVTDSESGEIFYGRVYGTEKSSAYGTVTANCIDDAQRLLQSKVKYSFVGKTPEEIATLILADYGFPTGALEKTGITLKTYVVNGKSIYDAINGAYAEAEKKTGKHYLFSMKGRALSTKVSGETVTAYVISEGSNITESHYTEKSDSVVNKVVVYDAKGNRRGTVEDAGSQERYGTCQDIYQQTENSADANTAAKNKIAEPEQSLSVTALGDISCVAGSGITLKDTATGQNGLFWIKNDKHTFENGIHTMELELSFKKITGKSKT